MTYRQTKQKQEVLEAIQGVNRHLTAEEVHQVVVKNNPTVGIATVYRNLNHLVERRVISRIVEKGSCYFDGNGEPHYHLRCIHCGKYHDVSMEYNKKLDKNIAKELGVEILGHSITFDYICNECKTETTKN